MTETYTVAKWETHPYTGYQRRGQSVFHRVRLKQYDQTAADVIVERRAPADGLTSWTEVESYELRPHGVTHVDKRAEAI